MNENLKKSKNRKSLATIRAPALPLSNYKAIRFSPTAWAKLLYLRDAGTTEVGGFGIASEADPLLVEDIQLVRQTCSWSHVKFADDSVADFFDQQVDAGRRPEQFGRIWIHTHPGRCPQPSGTDEQTFERVFGRVDWAVMFILACEGATYARLRFNVGPGADVEISTEIDFTQPFNACDHQAWAWEYDENVSDEMIRPELAALTSSQEQRRSLWTQDDWYEPWFEYLDDDLAIGRRDDLIH